MDKRATFLVKDDDGQYTVDCKVVTDSEGLAISPLEEFTPYTMLTELFKAKLQEQMDTYADLDDEAYNELEQWTLKYVMAEIEATSAGLWTSFRKVVLAD